MPMEGVPSTSAAQPLARLTESPSIRELSARFRRREVTPVEITQDYLERIHAENSRLNAYITIDDEGALEAARRREEEGSRGECLSLLDGVPVGVKDNFEVAGLPTSVGTDSMRGRISTTDSAVALSLKRDGAIVLGKLHLHEWAIGATSVNPFFGPAKNPWDPRRSPGGSSGGAAVALAADLAMGAVGSDTGGSVRIPAALCGVSGLRPTVGSISTRGLWPVSWTHDTPGPMARRAEDVAILFDTLAGYDPDDPVSTAHEQRAVLDVTERGVAGIKVGLLGGAFEADSDPEVYELVRGACDRLSDLGAQPREVVLQGVEEALDCSSVITHAEAAAVHRERLDSGQVEYGSDVLKRLTYGSGISAVDYAVARHGARRWARTLAAAFEDLDVIVTPTCSITAPMLDESDGVETTKRLTRFTYPFTLANVPAMSIPCGFSTDGLPIGLQLVADHWHERQLFRIACAFQDATQWHLMKPQSL